MRLHLSQSHFFLYTLYVHNNNLIVNTNNIANTNLQPKILKNGDAVLVRILSQLADGRYSGSVAGHRVTLNASSKLIPGSTFIGNVLLKNGTIHITPQNTVSEQSAASSVELKVLQESDSAKFLISIGLPPDSLSLHLFLQLKQLGLKYEPKLMNRLHDLALKFPGKEKRAAEILLLLEKKGITASEEEIAELLNEIDSDEVSQSSAEVALLESQESISAQDIKDFFNSMVKFAAENTTGLLTIFNHLGNEKSGEGNWVFFPFEITKSEKVLGQGTIKLFLCQKKLDRILLNCDYGEKKYFFSLQNKFVRFNVDGASESQISSFKNTLEQKLKLINREFNVQFVDSELLEGTGCEDEEILSFGAMV